METQTKQQEISSHEALPWWNCWISSLLTIFVSIGICILLYSAWGTTLLSAKGLGFLGLFLVLFFLFLFIRNPEIPERNSSFIWLFIFLVFGTFFLLSFGNIWDFLRSNKDTLRELFNNKDVKIPNWLEITEKSAEKSLKTIKKNEIESQKLLKETRDIIEFLNLEAQAKMGKMDALDKIASLSKNTSDPRASDFKVVFERLEKEFAASYFHENTFRRFRPDMFGIATDSIASLSLTQLRDAYWEANRSVADRETICGALNRGEIQISPEEIEGFFYDVIQRETNIYPMLPARRYLQFKYQLGDDYDNNFSVFVSKLDAARHEKKLELASAAQQISPTATPAASASSTP